MHSKRLFTRLLRTFKFAYFAPITALWLKRERGGRYLQHLMALRRLAQWYLN